MHEPINLAGLTAMGLDPQQAAALMERIRALQEEAQAQTRRADALQARLDETAQQLAGAQADQAQLQSLQAQLDEAQERLREAALTAAVLEFRPVNAQLILRLIDRTQLGFDGSAFTGLAEQIEAIRAAAPCLFEDAADPSGGHAGPSCAPAAFDMNAFLRGER